MTHETTVPEPRAVDVAVAERVMGFRWYVSEATGRRALFVPGSQPGWFIAFAKGDESLASDWDTSIERYSTDIAEASKVIDAVSAAGMHWWLGGPHGEGREWCAAVRAHEDHDTVASASERSLPLAICRAALAWAETREKTR